MSVGIKITKARDAKRLTLEALAKKLSISTGYLRLLESDGKVPLSPRLRDALSSKIGLTLSNKEVAKTNEVSKTYRDKLKKLRDTKKAHKTDPHAVALAAEPKPAFASDSIHLTANGQAIEISERDWYEMVIKSLTAKIKKSEAV